MNKDKRNMNNISLWHVGAKKMQPNCFHKFFLFGLHNIVVFHLHKPVYIIDKAALDWYNNFGGFSHVCCKSIKILYWDKAKEPLPFIPSAILQIGRWNFFFFFPMPLEFPWLVTMVTKQLNSTLLNKAFTSITLSDVTAKWSWALTNLKHLLKQNCISPTTEQIDGLVQDCGISIADAMEIPQSCTKLSIC